MTDIQTHLNLSLRNKLDSIKDELTLNQIEFGTLKKPLSIEFYEKWLSNNYHAGMTYLQTHLALKKNPQLIEASLKSVISLSQAYFPAANADQLKTPARVALYAKNEDYHIWLKQKLQRIIQQLELDFPNEIFLPYVDSGPILERDMAYQNGLGWFGKNTCLIHPEHGSLFFIAEILSSLDTSTTTNTIEALPDFCGTCTKCIDVCPTNALTEPRTLRADLCISYLTIESKTVAPIELRKKIGDWFFGCDLCQTVCPWNEKFFRKKKITSMPGLETTALIDLSFEAKAELVAYFEFLLTASHKQIQKYHFGSPLSRSGAKGLKRNALIVIANKNLAELRETVQKIESSELQELATWTLLQLTN